MNKKHLTRLSQLILVFGIVVLPMLLFINHVSASSTGYARWILDVSFDKSGTSHPLGNEIVAEWTVQILDQQGTVITSTTEYLSCAKIGAVSIQNDKALFNGGHVKCVMPSFADAVTQLTGRYLAVDANGTSQCANEDVDVWSRTDARPFANQPGLHPVFNHPSFNFEIDNNTTVSTKLESMLWGPTNTVITEAGPHSVTNGLNQFGTRLQACQFGQCTGKHRLNQTTPLIDVVQYPQNIIPRLFVEQTMVEIGFNPQTLDTFNGVIHTVSSDPGCVNEFD
jgi:hypothetical protein